MKQWNIGLSGTCLPVRTEGSLPESPGIEPSQNCEWRVLVLNQACYLSSLSGAEKIRYTHPCIISNPLLTEG